MLRNPRKNRLSAWDNRLRLNNDIRNWLYNWYYLGHTSNRRIFFGLNVRHEMCFK